MKTYQEKVLGEFERIAKLYGCEAVQVEESTGRGQVLAMRGWETRARVGYDFAGLVVTVMFNGADLSDGLNARRTEARVFGEIGAFARWADLLYAEYLCDDCDQAHRPGTKCVWPLTEYAELVVAYLRRREWPLTSANVAAALRDSGRAVADATVIDVYEEIRGSAVTL